MHAQGVHSQKKGYAIPSYKTFLYNSNALYKNIHFFHKFIDNVIVPFYTFTHGKY